jgi:hypothetical protein
MTNGSRQLRWIRRTAATIAVAALATAGAPAEASPVLPTIRSGVLDQHRVAAVAWRGGRYATRTGEQVKVFVSPAYASDPGTAQQWADFFASLVHGSELGLLTAYIAPLDEVQELCHADFEVLGCYGAQQLVTVGEPVDGLQPTSVATHEYGHHVANNRLNAPWVAIDWGTKRWTSYMNVCARTAGGTAFPGDEGFAYTLNPGEAFAESYRVLNETQAGSPLTWPIVDPSFLPDATALQAVRDDVLQPWTAPTTRTVRARFIRGRHAWTMKLATPLDGDLSVRLAQGSDDLDLLGGRRTVIARGSWSSTGGKSLEYRICGQRSLTIRVRSDGRPSRFTLRVTQP